MLLADKSAIIYGAGGVGGGARTLACEGAPAAGCGPHPLGAADLMSQSSPGSKAG
jgi:hypothetical protein